MLQMQVCPQGHRWDPLSDTRTTEEERFNRCPVCGAAASIFSLHDSNPMPPAGRAVPPSIEGYEIFEELGRGGAAIVYRARQRRSGMVVALKMILAGPSATESARERLRTEAAAVAGLKHPNIVHVLDSGEREGDPWFALEFMDGGTLAASLSGTSMPPRYAAELIATLADAVQSAHDLGIIHRDLKPANVLLTSMKSANSDTVTHLLGTPKISDFGLAKRLGVDMLRTRPGAVLGTPSYMAPEQAAGRSKEAGPAADVYALGAILYECLTGRPPFEGASILKTLELVRLTKPAPPSTIMPGVPRALEAICLKLLEKLPEQRYASARALADDLQRFLHGEPVAAQRKSGFLARLLAAVGLDSR